MTVSPWLDEKVIAISDVLRHEAIPHGFGGAIALGYYGEPRSTIDIDIHIFVDAGRADPVLGLLKELGIVKRPKDELEPQEAVHRDGQVRLTWDGTLVDLFFVNHAFHEESAKRIREVPYVGGHAIWILAVEDLVMFKLAFNRRRDWLDIEQVLFAMAGTFDLAYLRRWAARSFLPDDPRLAMLEDVIDRILGPDA